MFLWGGTFTVGPCLCKTDVLISHTFTNDFLTRPTKTMMQVNLVKFRYIRRITMLWIGSKHWPCFTCMCNIRVELYKKEGQEKHENATLYNITITNVTRATTSNLWSCDKLNYHWWKIQMYYVNASALMQQNSSGYRVLPVWSYHSQKGISPEAPLVRLIQGPIIKCKAKCVPHP